MDFDIKKSKSFFGNGLLEKTVFDGKMTVKQLLLIVVVVIAVLLVLKLVTGVMKTILLVVIIAIAVLRFGLTFPATIKDTDKKIAEEGIATYNTKYVNRTDNLKSSGNNISIKVGDEWISVKEVESILYPNPLTGKKMGISIDGEIYQVEDEYVINMLKSFTDGNILHQIFGTFKDKK